MTTFTFITRPDWTDCETYHGVIPGYSCGYNFEVKTRDGRIDFMSCTFDSREPEECAEDECQKDHMAFLGLTYTGRVIFRGYYEEHYDYEERESYYTKVARPFGNYEPIPAD